MAASTKVGKRTRISGDTNGQFRGRTDNGEPVTLRAHKRIGVLEDRDPDLPPLPPADEHGNYPAIATARVIIARQIIRGRKTAGWTQAELAKRAGVRQETISRLETGKHSAGVKTMAKIDKALKKAGA